jgi:hypothetical protein
MKKTNTLFRIFLVFSLVVALLLGTAVFYFRNVSMLLGAAFLHTTPPYSWVKNVRKDLMEQAGFQKILKKHEAVATARYQNSGRKNYTNSYNYKLSISMFDMPFFSDYWQTLVRTDIVRGKPKTSFLIRLGIVKDKNAETFFSQQCQSKMGRGALTFLIKTYNKLFDWGILKPYRINITESDVTSSVGSKRLSIEKWEKVSEALHLQENLSQ